MYTMTGIKHSHRSQVCDGEPCEGFNVMICQNEFGLDEAVAQSSYSWLLMS